MFVLQEKPHTDIVSSHDPTCDSALERQLLLTMYCSRSGLQGYVYASRRYVRSIAPEAHSFEAKRSKGAK